MILAELVMVGPGKLILVGLGLATLSFVNIYIATLRLYVLSVAVPGNSFYHVIHQ